jgi:hypothetical protein
MVKSAQAEAYYKTGGIEISAVYQRIELAL